MAAPNLFAPKTQDKLKQALAASIAPLKPAAPSLAAPPSSQPVPPPPAPARVTATPAVDALEAGTQTMTALPGKHPGQLEPGNINLNGRPIVHNPDGSVSTVRTITVTGDGGKATLLPTVVGDKVVSPTEAIQHWQQTGQHLGVFKDESTADAYAQKLHEQQAARYSGAIDQAGRQQAAKPVDAIGGAQQGNRALYLNTVAQVRAGKLAESAAAKRLQLAGLPDGENPFLPSTGSVGQVAHDIAAPLGLSRSTNAANERDETLANIERAGDKQAAAEYERTGLLPAKYEPKSGGTVSPGTGLLAQLAAQVADNSVNSPGGAVSAIVHPERTAGQLEHGIGQDIHDPEHHLGDLAFAGWAGASGASGLLSRLAGARGAFKAAGEPDFFPESGAGTPSRLKAALTRPGHAGGSLLHSPEPGVATIHAPGGAPQPTDGPLEEAQKVAADAEAAHVEAVNRYHALAGAPGATLRDIERARTVADAAREHAAQVADEQQTTGVVRGPVAEGPRNAQPVDRLLSRNVLARNLFQGSKPLERAQGTGVLDRVAQVTQRNTRLQKQLLTGEVPSPRTAVGKAIREVFSPQAMVGRELRAKGRFDSNYANALPREQMRAVNGILSGLTRGERAAVGVVGVEGHNAFADPAEVIGRHIDTHQRFIDEGKGVDENGQHIVDLKLAQHALENPSDRFKRALGLTSHLSRQTEEKLIERLPENERQAARDTFEQRRAHMASIYNGAVYEKPTPGKLGVSPALDRAASRVDRLQNAYDRLDEKGLRGGYPVETRPRTVEEAQARLDELEKEHAKQLDKIVKAQFGPADMNEVRFRNRENAKAARQESGKTKSGRASGASGFKATKRPTVREEQRATVERQIEDAAAKHPENEHVQRWMRRADEIDELRNALNPTDFLGEKTGEMPTVTEGVYKRSAPSLERRGGALGVAKEELEQQERRVHGYTDAKGKFHPGTVRDTGFVGNTVAAPEGSFYFPMSSRYTYETPRTSTRAGGSSPGPYGMAPAAESRYVPGLHHEFSGESVEKGLTPHDIANAIADRGIRVNRLIQTEGFYHDMWRVADPVRRASTDVPIRDGKKIEDELKQFFSKLADRVHATPDEAMTLDHHELEELTKNLEARDADYAGVGETVPGVRWVPHAYLKSMGETSVRGPVEKFFDVINNPIRSTQLYLRPAYILNLAGNLGMQGITEGARVFPSMTQAVRANALYGDRNTGLVDSLLGQSRSRTYSVKTGFAHGMNEHLSEAWNAVTDMYSRRSAFFTEAARAGYRTPEQVDALLHNPELRRKLYEVTRRANKNIVDYDSLTPLEKNTIRRIMYFYPWVSRGTLWALRAIVENPGKTFTLMQLGRIGAQNAEKKLGPLPAWAAQLGLIPVGAPHDGVDPKTGKVLPGDEQGTMNLSSMWTPTTVVQLAESLIHPLDKNVGLSNLTTPATGMGIALGGAGAGDTKRQGVFGHVGGWLGPLASVAESLPPVQAIRRSGLAPWLAGGPSKTYPDTGVGDALGPFTIGGLYDRDVSKSALASQHEKALPAPQRASDRVATERDDLLGEAQRLGLLPKGAPLPPALARAYAIQQQRMTLYAKLPATAGQGERLKVDLQLGVKVGSITRAQAAQLEKLIPTLSATEISRRRKMIAHDFLGGGLLTEARTEIRKRGGDVKP